MQQERVATSTRPRQEVSSLADKRSQRRGCPAPATRECMPCTSLYNKQQDFKSLTSDLGHSTHAHGMVWTNATQFSERASWRSFKS